jgi:hypothetical protein
VIPRDAAEPRGKRPQRAQTFATHVELEGMLSRATPLFPIDAIEDEPAEPEKPAEETAADRRGMVAPPLALPGREPPSRAVLIVFGLGGLALCAAAIYVFYQGRSQVLRADAAIDAPIDAAPDATLDAAPPDAPPADAALDAAVRVDAAVKMAAIDAARPDAAVIDAAAAMGTLKVGADPWGQIVIDGKPSGNTPRELTIAAGHHTVEVVFPGVNPPRKQTFAVDLAGGETKSVQADFH